MRTLLILPAMLAASPALALDHGRDAVREAAAVQTSDAGAAAPALHHRASQTHRAPELTLNRAEGSDDKDRRYHLIARTNLAPMVVRRDGDDTPSRSAQHIERQLLWETPLIPGFQFPADAQQSSHSK